MSNAVDRRNPAAGLDANPRHRRTLFIHAYLAGFTALQILYLALDDLKLNLALSLSFTAGYVFAYSLPPRWRAPAEYTVSALAVAASIYCGRLWTQDMSMYGNLLGILGGVLMVLLSFRAFTTNAHRFLLMLCVVFLLFGAVASYDLKFMLLLPLFLIFAGCALYVANQIDVHSRALSARGERMPAGGGLNRKFMGVLLRSIALVLVLSIAAYIMAPHSAAQPRGLVLNRAGTVEEAPEEAESPDEPQEGEDESAQTGIGEDYDMTSGGELRGDPTPALKVKSHRAGYLRAKVYDLFTGTGWEQSARLQPNGNKPGQLLDLPQVPDYYSAGSTSSSYDVPLVDFPSSVSFAEQQKALRLRLVEGNVYSDNNLPNLNYDIIQQQVTFLQKQSPYFMGSYQPFRITNISRTASGGLLQQPYVDLASTVRPIDLARDFPENFSYTIHSLEPRASIRQLDEVYAQGPKPIIAQYTWLPFEGEDWQAGARERGLDPSTVRPISQRFVNFVRTKFSGPDLVDGREVFPSVWDKAKRVNDWLVSSGEFDYRMDHPALPEGREVTEAFCFDTRSGWCRYFASTMAVISRINGIPARVVTGFAPGSFSLAENAYLYRNSNAHAWVELYFDGYGWIMFDPTPQSRSPYSESSGTQILTTVVDFLQDLFVIDPASTQRTIIEGLRMLWAAIVANALQVATVTAACAAVAGLAWLLRWRLRKRKPQFKLQAESQTVGAYLDLQRQLRQLGFVLETGDTAREVFATVAVHFPQLGTPLQTFLPLYERAAFGPIAPPDSVESEALRLAGEVRSIVEAELERRRNAKRGRQ